MIFPFLVDVICNAAPSIEHGYVEPATCNTDGASRLNDVCMYRCKEGFRFDKDADWGTCSKTGTWIFQRGSRIPPKCVRKS